jgi:hypothetical protein
MVKSWYGTSRLFYIFMWKYEFQLSVMDGYFCTYVSHICNLERVVC